MKALACVLLVSLMLGGCAAEASTVAPAASPATSTPMPTTSPSAPATPVPSPTVVPIPSAASSGSLVVAYEGAAQVELIPRSGHRVLIDVYNPDFLSRPATSDDILLTTHSHDDHYFASYVDAFPGKKLTMTTGTIKTDDVSIVSILGQHHADPDLSIPNYIFVIEIAGLRVVHFGDLGQDALSAGQLAVIGRVDVAVSQLSNSFSDMSADNRKGVNLMNQVHPKLLVVTHMIEDPIATAKMAAAVWKVTWTPKAWISVTAAGLPSATTAIFMGNGADSLAKLTNATKTDW